jgi:hypothetical protein
MHEERKVVFCKVIESHSAAVAFRSLPEAFQVPREEGQERGLSYLLLTLQLRRVTFSAQKYEFIASLK